MVASASVYSNDIRSTEKKPAPYRDDEPRQLRSISFASSAKRTRKSNGYVASTKHPIAPDTASLCHCTEGSIHATCATCLDSGEGEAMTAGECSNVAWSRDLAVDDTPYSYVSTLE